MEREETASNLQYMWMGSNLKYEGIKEVIDKLSFSNALESDEPSVNEINNDWKRLASFISGQR